MGSLFPRSLVFVVLAATEADHRCGQVPRLHAIERHPGEYTASWVLSLCHVYLGLGEITPLGEPEADPELCAQCCSMIAWSGLRGRVVRHAVAG
ncbi:hypothetical protein SAMN04487820_108258 [Actinopolyspora mzabensis]|uniref:Uncharacterized protein n=1 Tax=Actinopolyspora mzabensis TaxID=995066 RepID=A0A1G9CDD4_ACTMZ|nr:hypothetical protein [Actinopolyspora mzabensis]SDK49683.1 hypothetical protein SAMN04487820_108258 [Actinopolyspora mzabensis]